MMTLAETGAALRSRKTTALELTTQALQKIERVNPRLNAFITVTADAARGRASALDAELQHGRDRGPLHGIPVAVKDLFETRGVRTTGGSKLFEHYIPQQDAAVVQSLDRAGAVLLGKTGLHEMAYGITSTNPWFGAVRNPWDPERIPGGSSGGSGAAVAADMCVAAMGSDTGGSIRIPSSFCGTAGLKPTFGRVSRFGAFPLGFSLDHMGPLAATVRDAAVVYQAIAGYDRRDDTTSRELVGEVVPGPNPSIAGLRIGRPRKWFFEGLAPEVSSAMAQLLRTAESLGARVVEVDTPDFAEINLVARVVLLAEASALMENHLGDRDKIGADVLALLDQGRLLAATEYLQAQRLRRILCDEFRKVWSECEVLLVPATPTPAPRIGQTTLITAAGEEDVRLATTRLVRGFNLLGVPVVSLPAGFSPDGLPLGAQVVGPEFAEALVLRAAAALEDVTGFYRRRPQWND